MLFLLENPFEHRLKSLTVKGVFMSLKCEKEFDKEQDYEIDSTMLLRVSISVNRDLIGDLVYTLYDISNPEETEIVSTYHSTEKFVDAEKDTISIELRRLLRGAKKIKLDDEQKRKLNNGIKDAMKYYKV